MNVVVYVSPDGCPDGWGMTSYDLSVPWNVHANSGR